MDVGFHGSKYTWHNNQSKGRGIWARLDRVLVNPAWMNLIPIYVEHLSKEASDHAPLLIHTHSIRKMKSRFYFQKMWTLHDSYINDIASFWHNSQVASSPMTTLNGRGAKKTPIF